MNSNMIKNEIPVIIGLNSTSLGSPTRSPRGSTRGSTVLRLPKSKSSPSRVCAVRRTCRNQCIFVPIALLAVILLCPSPLFRCSNTNSFNSFIGLLRPVSGQSDSDASTGTTGNCTIKVWAYTSLDMCQSLQGPNAVMDLTADRECRKSQPNSGTTHPWLLPGVYRAQCTADGKHVRFLESGCVFDDCSSTTIGADQCQRNSSSESSLYSRAMPPEFPVLTVDQLTSIQFNCSYISDGDTLGVTFVLQGDCSSPNCVRMDTSSPTQAPIVSTPQPTPTEPVTQQPSASPGTTQPTAPVRVESASVAILLAEIEGMFSNDNAVLWQKVTALHIKGTLRESYDIRSVLINNIKQELLDEAKQIISTDSIASLPPQNTSGTPQITTTNQNERYQLRYLDEQLDKTLSIRIYFDLYVTLPESTPSNVTASRVFSEAFDTESERTIYLLNLERTNDAIFANVKKLKILNDGSGNATTPAPGPTSSTGDFPTLPPDGTDDGGMSIGIVAGAAVGAVFIFMIFGLFLYKRGKKDAMSKIEGEENPTDLSPSSTNQSSQLQLHNNPHHQQLQQRWTNEIILDPANDDISTLGGSTLADLMMTNNNTGSAQHQGNITADDEHTASVNVDYDFVKQRYRTGAGTITEEMTIDGDRSRSVLSDPTQYTTYSKLGMTMAGGTANNEIFADDDQSFERQYAGTDDENGEDFDTYLDDVGYDEHVQVDPNGKITHKGGTAARGAANAQNIRNNNSLTITPNSSMMIIPQSSSSPSSQSSTSQLSKPFEIRVPPGMLGMVVDTPGGCIPIVRAIKSSSVLFHRVHIGDLLLQVDSIDVSKMPAVQVSNLISTRSHLDRTLVFVRPLPTTPNSGSTNTNTHDATVRAGSGSGSGSGSGGSSPLLSARRTQGGEPMKIVLPPFKSKLTATASP